MELQANDPMLFRDWEDSLKEKYPTIYNEGRINTMSLKDWKNNELSKNLTNKWGFKMDLKKLNENKEVEEHRCGGEHDRSGKHKGADESHCMEEQLEEEEIKNPGKYIDGERTKAGVDDDGDGVPNKADKDPKDGSKK